VLQIVRKLAKILPFVGTAAWYGCVAHCGFEYCGDFALVSYLATLL
jgi:hypothetical protein